MKKWINGIRAQWQSSARSRSHRLFVRLIIVTGLVVLPILLMECLSLLVLHTGIIKLPPGSPLRKFPAQLRMSRTEIIDMIFGPHGQPLQIRRFTHRFKFDFDPVLGFRLPGGIGWAYYDQSSQIIENKTLNLSAASIDELRALPIPDKAVVLLVLGGSTTFAYPMWPGHLIQIAQKSVHKPPVVILNFAGPGFSTFSEKTALSSWILPSLERAGIRPSAIVSMDGVNDVIYMIIAYQEHLRDRDGIWISSYHGYHRLLEKEVRDQLVDWRANLAQLGSTVLSGPIGLGVVELVGRTVPHTYWVTKRLFMKLAPEKPVSHIFSRFAAVFDPETGKTFVRLPRSDETMMVGGMRVNLLDLMGTAQVHDIPFYAFLQPICQKDFYPLSKSRLNDPKITPGIEFLLQKMLAAYDLRAGVFYPVTWGGLYAQMDALYGNLNRKFPGHYISLSRLFNNAAEDVYLQDGVHYTTAGSGVIAERVFRILRQRGIL